jgi:hypothetical protein
MAMSANSDWLDQFEEGNAAGGHAGEVDVIPYPAVPPSMTSRRFPRPGTREGIWAPCEAVRYCDCPDSRRWLPADGVLRSSPNFMRKASRRMSLKVFAGLVCPRRAGDPVPLEPAPR